MKTGKIIYSGIILMLVLFSIASPACLYGPSGKCSGPVIKQERNVSGFDQLEVSGAFKVFLTQGDNESLTVEAPDDAMEKIVTEVIGGKLKIYTESMNWHCGQVNIYLTFKELNSFDFSGAVEIEGRNAFRFENLALDVSGAAELDMEFQAVKLDADLSGASEIDFRGSCGRAYFEISGASELSAENWQVEELSLEVSGASSTRVSVSKELNVDASGASDVRYKGNPVVHVSSSGASSVDKID